MSIRRTMAAAMAGIVLGTAAPLTAWNSNNNSVSAEETGSAVKPSFHISSAEIYEKDAVKGKTCRVTLSVEGVDKGYCSTHIYLYYDSKLKVSDVQTGTAAAELESAYMNGDTGDFIFLSTAGKDNLGLDGEMWHIDFVLPENSEAGDEYEVYLGDSKYGRIPLLFTNFEDDEYGESITSQIFRTSAKAKIKVADDPPYILGDFNDDGVVNGVDASGILSYYAKSSVNDSHKLSRYEKGSADVNKDNVVNGVDASSVLRYYAYVSTNEDMSYEEYLEATPNQPHLAVLY